MEQETNNIHESPAPERKKGRVLTVSILLGVAILLCVLVIGQVLGKGYVSLGGYSLFRVVTGSMEPTMEVGAILIVKDVPIQEIQAGEIVTYRSREPGKFRMIITHRVINVHTGSDGGVYLETKGDANPYADPNYVDENYLIGKVISYTKENNLFADIISLVTSKVGFLACIVFPCIVIGVFVMRDCITSMRSEIDAINAELDTKQTESKENLQQMEQEDYDALCQRLRNELMEELKQGAEPETTEQQPGTGQHGPLLGE